MGLNELLKMEFTTITPTRVEAQLPITDDVRQMHGFVHGGTTLALLESVASQGAEACADTSCELPFGLNVNVTHHKSGVDGMLHGVATFNREEKSSKGYRKQFWDVAAYDDAGDVVSDGSVLCLIVPKDAATPNPHVK